MVVQVVVDRCHVTIVIYDHSNVLYINCVTNYACSSVAIESSIMLLECRPKWKGSNHKQSTRWQHVSRLKASAFCTWKNKLW